MTKEIINQENHVQKIIQLLRWNMYFCWVNSNLILKCAEMYGYAMSEDLRVMLKALTDEIQKFLNQNLMR